MKFDELDSEMRLYETINDFCVLPGIFMVARIDGRSFSKLTKEVHAFTAPYDERFRDHMVATVMHLMTCGFRVIYGYTQSDEISLLFHPEEASFGRKLRKYHSVLAGEASARFSLALGDLAAFDCRISQLPSAENVVSYFRWRSEDAHRNALNSHCYWSLRKSGISVSDATSRLRGMSTPEKNELLFTGFGINFNDLPLWQKRGIGVYWEGTQKEGLNPLTGASTTALRKALKVDLDLPMKDKYADFISNLLGSTAVAK